VPEQSAFEFEMVIENLKRHKSPAIDQMPQNSLRQGVEELAHIHKVINSV
jgi:hypothetical protein